METTFRILYNNRRIFLQFLNSFTLEELNKIPQGFNENIIWNIGHIVVTQQILIYKFSGLPMMISDRLEKQYKNGTFPKGDARQDDVDEIKSLILKTIHQTETDFKEMPLFSNFQPYTTKSTLFTLNNVTEALEFNNFHEGIHLGILLQIKKFL